LATCIFLFFYNEPELGVGINPCMALTPLPSSIGRGSNPRPSDCEPSALPLDHSFRYEVTNKSCKSVHQIDPWLKIFPFSVTRKSWTRLNVFESERMILIDIWDHIKSTSVLIFRWNVVFQLRFELSMIEKTSKVSIHSKDRWKYQFTRIPSYKTYLSY